MVDRGQQHKMMAKILKDKQLPQATDRLLGLKDNF